MAVSHAVNTVASIGRYTARAFARHHTHTAVFAKYHPQTATSDRYFTTTRSFARLHPYEVPASTECHKAPRVFARHLSTNTMTTSALHGSECIRLSKNEMQSISKLIDSLEKRFQTVEKEEFANICKIVAHDMPLGLRKICTDFRNCRENIRFLLIEGFPIDDKAIGGTPSHWDVDWKNPKTLREEIFQCLIASCLGEIFGWRTQENGRYLRHIVPIEKEKNEQLGGSSAVTLVWHIEEAFHPQRADMMTIMCYRNEEKAETNLCSIMQLNIPDHYRTILKQPRFIIKPDKSHFPENNISQHWQLSDGQFKKIQSFQENPVPVPVLESPNNKEVLCIDEAFMEALPGDTEAKEALEWLYRYMNEQKISIVMKPGDILLLDNRTTAHSRSPYVPNYGPSARWLRRVNIAADLRKSYQWKETASSRVIL